MPDPALSTGELEQLLASEQLRQWLVQQRWYSSKSRTVSALETLEQIPLGGDLHLALVQAHLATGTREVYQLLVRAEHGGADGDGDPTRPQPIARTPELTAYDALLRPPDLLVVLERMLADEDVLTEQGSFAFRHVEGALHPGTQAAVRTMGVEQSNSSVVIDERTTLKLIRKVESGINPELEVLRFLTARGFAHVPRLEGWYEYEGSSLASTLGIAMGFVSGGRDGWELALEGLGSAPERFLEQLGQLGEVTGQMHTLLASDPDDPAFSPQDPISESVSLLIASIDEDIEETFSDLPNSEALAPIYGRGADVRAMLATRSQPSSGGKQIRIHGDYHLGQALRTPAGWVILDFEGEPARPLPERRQKRSALRDVAGILRSLAYAVSTLELRHGRSLPEGTEARAREAFLTGYLQAVDPMLLPAGRGAVADLLSIFEVQKAVYELRYELGHRPEWLAVPAACIARLLEHP